jgi:hypothetical protein
LISTRVDPRSVVYSVQQKLRSIVNNALVLATITMDEHMRIALYENRVLVQLVTAIAMLGFVLATEGLYRVIWYSVSRKTHEIGVRILMRALSTLLFGVRPIDPSTFAAVSLLVLTVAAAACVIPTRCASKIDPTTALRYE